MNRFVTITTFTYAQEVLVLRGRLESEGIVCFVPDEQTIQMHPFYSNALGGLRLQVRESDFEKAAKILEEGGYVVETSPQEIRELAELAKNENEFSPNKKRVKRWLGWGVVVLIVLLIALKFLSMKGEVNQNKMALQLIDYKWCVTKISSKGMDFVPNTTRLKLGLNNDLFCREDISFMDRGKLLLPGFNSPQFNGYWYFVADSIQIINCDTLGDVFNNTYSIELSADKLYLRSDKTMITCEKSTKK